MSEQTVDDPAADWRWTPGSPDDYFNPAEHPHKPGFVCVHREVHSYNANLERFIERMRSVAEGLEDPGIELATDAYGEIGVLYITGYRPKTEYDRARLEDHRHRSEAQQRAEYERLRAKFDPDYVVGGE